MIRLTSLLAEVTDMIFIVAKTAKPQDKQTAVRAAEYLKKQGIVARAKFPAKFDYWDRKEPRSWGIFTTGDAEEKALSLLKRSPQADTGLVFDDQEHEM